MLARPATPTGNVHKGRQLMLRYRLQPAQRQLRAARSKLAVKMTVSGKSAPCFTCSKVKTRRAGRRSLDLADLEEAWAKVAGDAKPNVQVHDLLELAALSKRPDAGDAFDDLVRVPHERHRGVRQGNRRRGQRRRRADAHGYRGVGGEGCASAVANGNAKDGDVRGDVGREAQDEGLRWAFSYAE